MTRKSKGIIMMIAGLGGIIYLNDPLLMAGSVTVIVTGYWFMGN